MKWNWSRAAATCLPGKIPLGNGKYRDISGYTHDMMHASLAAAAKQGHRSIACEVGGCESVSGDLAGVVDTRPVDELMEAWAGMAQDDAGKPAAERPIEPYRRYLYPNLPRYWSDQTFETFACDDENRDAFEVARAWAESPEGVLVFLGPTGTGKTHLAAAITHHTMLAGMDVSVWEFDAWVDALRDVFAASDRNEVKAFEHRMLRAGLLVIDEIRAESTSDAVRDMFELIVRQRTGEQRPMLITTNANEESWQTWSQRAYSRLRHHSYATWVPMIGDDRRRAA